MANAARVNTPPLAAGLLTDDRVPPVVVGKRETAYLAAGREYSLVDLFRYGR